MNNYTVSDVTRELGISKSYLYKIIKKENIILNKNKSGRYLWTSDSIEQIKPFLKSSQEIEDGKYEKIVSELGLKQSYINNRRYLGNKHSLSGFIRKKRNYRWLL